MHRFFVSPDQIEDARVVLSAPQAHQVARVLRLRPGDPIGILDGSGAECAAVLEAVSPARAVARLQEWHLCPAEPRTHLALGLGLLKGEKMEWAIQKVTEVGASRILPVACARSVVRLEEERAAGKVRRWQQIAQEAAEQCRRGRVPQVAAPLSWPALLDHAAGADVTLLADEQEATPLAEALRTALPPSQHDPTQPARVLLLVGPEGGFTPEETTAARAVGAIPVSLGPRILRAETAAVVGAALLLHLLEE